jgi:hypothetical protein
MSRARWVLTAIVISNATNESSNALVATVLPWAMRSADMGSKSTLLAISLLLLLLSGFCWLIKKTVQQYGLRKTLAVTIIGASMITVISMIQLHVNIIWITPALVTIMLIEPFIAFCTSALSPLAAEKSAVDKQRFSALLLAVGSLSTFSTPWLASPLQEAFGQPGLAYGMLVLSLISLLSLIPLLAKHYFELSSTESRLENLSKNHAIQPILNWLSILIALLIGLETAWLPAAVSSSANALTRQAGFVSFAALGAVIGAVLVIALQFKILNISIRLQLALLVTIVSTILITAHPSAAVINSAAIMIGLSLGICLPLLEVTLQTQLPDTQSRMLGLIVFYIHLSMRITAWLLLLAIIS